MASVKLPRRVKNLRSMHDNSINLNNNDRKETKDMISGSCPTDSCHYMNNKNISQWSKWNYTTKTMRASSYNEDKTPSSSSNNNRFKHLCSRVIRRFSLTKEHRTSSIDMNRGLAIRFNNYKSFSSKTDESLNDFEWPDFELIYDSIPHCLSKTLPGPEDLSAEDNDMNSIDTLDSSTDEIDDYLMQQMNLFEQCKRGKDFRRNGLCYKLDKSQYKGQLNTFIQQLMIEKLMRTWT